MNSIMTFNRRHIVIGAASLFALVLSASPAMANQSAWGLSKDKPALTQSYAPQIRNQTPPNLGRWAQRKISASEAKAIARRRVPGGEVVDISKRGNDWRVRVIRKDGRVRDIIIDGSTGRVKN